MESVKPAKAPAPTSTKLPSSLGSGSSTTTGIANIHAYIWYSIPLLVKASLTVNGLLRTLAADTTWDRCWGIAFVLLALTGTCLSLYLIRRTWQQWLTPEQVSEMRAMHARRSRPILLWPMCGEPSA